MADGQPTVPDGTSAAVAGTGNEREGLVKRRRVVVKTMRVKKVDLPKLTGAVRGEAVPVELFDELPEAEVVLSGPAVAQHVLECRVTKCRILRPVEATELPEFVSSHQRPLKKTTALLWSRQRFLRRLFEIKKRGQKRK